MSYMRTNLLRRGSLWLPATVLYSVMSFTTQVAPAGAATEALRNFEKAGPAPAVSATQKVAPVPPRVTSVALAVVDDSWTGYVNGTIVTVGTNFTIGTDAFATIQDGIDALSAGGTVKVLPGTYNETAAGRFLFNATGPYQFGIFVGAALPGITVQGVDAGGTPIGSAGAVAAFVTTNATNSFGTSGVFIEGDGVTMSGLSIGVNTTGTNKTIEVIGDAFKLQNSVVADAEGSVYLNDWRYDVGTNTSHLQSYTIQGNIFQAGNSIDIASGAGYSGPAAGRLITGNSFTNAAGEYWPMISFNGSGTGVPWFVYSVGGAVITGNTFTNTDPTGQNIRARGTYDNTQFDWASYFNANTYDRATIVGPAPPANVRTYSYVSGPYTLNDVRRVGAVIQPEVDHAAAGDIVLAKAGTYEEQVVIGTNGVTLQGAGLLSTIVKSPLALTASFVTAPNTNFPVVFVNGATGVTVRDLTVDGAGRGNANYRFQGIGFWNSGGRVEAVAVQNIQDTPFSGAQHGVGVYANNNTGGPYTLELSNVTVTTYQKNAMALSGAGLTVNVHDCSTTGAGPTTVTAQNGIQVGSGASGVLSNCNVANVNYTPATVTATGLLFINGGTVNVTGSNAVTNCQTGLYYQDTNGAAAGCNISGSSWAAVLGNAQASFAKANGIAAGAAAGHVQAAPLDDEATALRAALPGTAATLYTVSLANGCLVGSDVTGSSGVYVWSNGGGMSAALNNLEVSDWDEAIVADGPVTVTAHNNSITSNLTAGFDNLAPALAQNAEFNWWGAAGGPAGGNAVLGANVDTYPWLSTGADVNAGCGFTPVVLSVNTVTPVAPATCISTVNPCVTVAVNIARADATPMRAFSADIQLSPNLMLCSPSGSITEGSYLNSVSGTTFQVLSNGGGSYTIDCAILGLPCGATTATGNLFNVAVKNMGGDGTGTVTVTSVIARDCPNAPISVIPGGPASITIDNTLPASIANLNAAQVKLGNDTDGTTKVTVTYTAVGAASVEVYRAWYGTALLNAYPEYNDAAGAGVPATPGSYPPVAPWVLTGVTASGQADEVGARGFWYYVAYVKDACGNVSPVSNKTAGTLNYHLGDVSPVAGNNTVATPDISHLGSHYGITLVLNDTYNYLDVGPTSNFTVDALPTTDNRVQFEDLIMFAINYGQVGKTRVAPAPSAVDELMVLVPETADQGLLLAHLWIRGTGRIQGLSARLAWDAEVVEPVGLEAGSFLRDQGGVAFTPEPGTADIALLGTGSSGLAGEGELAVVRFRVKRTGDAGIHIAAVDARDANNKHVEMGTRSGGVSPEGNLPRVTALLANVPNPFNPTTRIPFTLGARGPVEIGVYTVDGRKVRTLVQGVRDAGLYETTWDGTDERGVRLASGAYYVRLVTGSGMLSRPIVMVK